MTKDQLNLSFSPLKLNNNLTRWYLKLRLISIQINFHREQRQIVLDTNILTNTRIIASLIGANKPMS